MTPPCPPEQIAPRLLTRPNSFSADDSYRFETYNSLQNIYRIHWYNDDFFPWCRLMTTNEDGEKVRYMCFALYVKCFFKFLFILFFIY
jgi:hypothetical protein